MKQERAKMKNIKQIDLAADLVGTLCTIFFTDNTKLAVTVPRTTNAPGYSATEFLNAVETQLGVPLNTIYAPEFSAQFDGDRFNS